MTDWWNNEKLKSSKVNILFSIETFFVTQGKFYARFFGWYELVMYYHVHRWSSLKPITFIFIIDFQSSQKFLSKFQSFDLSFFLKIDISVHIHHINIKSYMDFNLTGGTELHERSRYEIKTSFPTYYKRLMWIYTE